MNVKKIILKNPNDCIKEFIFFITSHSICDSSTMPIIDSKNAKITFFKSLGVKKACHKWVGIAI